MSIALDAIGLIPEGGVISAAFSLWHGAAGISNGTKISQRVGMAVGIVSTTSSSNDGNWFGATIGAAAIGTSLAKAAPIYGQVLSGVSLGGDAYSTLNAQKTCVDSGKYD